MAVAIFISKRLADLLIAMAVMRAIILLDGRSKPVPSAWAMVVALIVRAAMIAAIVALVVMPITAFVASNSDLNVWVWLLLGFVAVLSLAGPEASPPGQTSHPDGLIWVVGIVTSLLAYILRLLGIMPWLRVRQVSHTSSTEVHQYFCLGFDLGIPGCPARATRGHQGNVALTTKE